MPTRLPSIALALAGVSTLAAAAAPTEPPLLLFLRSVIRLDNREIAAMERGEVVTKQLSTKERAEIAAFGVVRVSGAPGTLLKMARNIETFRKGPKVAEIGRFGNPPRVEDLAGLTVERDDLDAVRECKPGKCDIKIGAARLKTLQKEVDWSAPDADARATAIIKKMMVDYVSAYRKGGTDAMGVIIDKREPKALSAEFRTLLRDSPFLFEYVPAFNRYLEQYPKGKLADTEDILYWSKVRFGLRPVIGIYHATLHKPAGPGIGALFSNKQIYASHYFNASLEISAAVPVPNAPGGAGFYLIDLHRARIDPPTGMLSGMLLGKVRGGIEEGVAESLKTEKARMEGGK